MVECVLRENQRWEKLGTAQEAPPDRSWPPPSPYIYIYINKKNTVRDPTSAPYSSRIAPF